MNTNELNERVVKLEESLKNANNQIEVLTNLNKKECSRLADLEKSLLFGKEDIERLKDRREDLDMVIEKAQKLEETVYAEMDKHRILANKMKDIDEEHARMFLMSERIAEKAGIFALQYSSVEESMGYLLSSMRRHDENIRTVNDTAKNLRAYVVQRLDEHEYETKKTTYGFEKRLEEKTSMLDTQLRFKMRVLEHELETKTTKDTEMVEKINKIVAELENFQKPQKVQPNQKTWKKWSQDQKVSEPKYEQAYPSLGKN